MEARRDPRVWIASVAAALVPVAGSRLAGAQGVPAPGPVPPAPPGGGGGIGVPLLIALGFIVLIVVAVRILDMRRRRRDEASAIEASLSDALLREPRLAGTVITTSAHLPLSRNAPPVIEVRGEVPYPELRDIALRAVRQEALRFHAGARVEDRIFVAPPVPAQTV